MFKTYYLKEKDLLIVSVPSSLAINNEVKERLKKEIKETSTIENILIIEGTFEVI